MTFEISNLFGLILIINFIQEERSQQKRHKTEIII